MIRDTRLVLNSAAKRRKRLRPPVAHKQRPGTAEEKTPVVRFSSQLSGPEAQGRAHAPDRRAQAPPSSAAQRVRTNRGVRGTWGGGGARSRTQAHTHTHTRAREVYTRLTRTSWRMLSMSTRTMTSSGSSLNNHLTKCSSNYLVVPMSPNTHGKCKPL